jgi:2-oxoglutarate ferredoxin oxidoreductase subunit alpha
MAFPPTKDRVIKVDSYAHDEFGITTDDPIITSSMNDKRFAKERAMTSYLENFETVKIYGSEKIALLTWGSNKGVCIEVAEKSGLTVIQVLVLSPFPVKKLKEALKSIERVIDVECNSTGQLARLAACHGIQINEKILKYDGRPFSIEDLDTRVSDVI